MNSGWVVLLLHPRRQQHRDHLPTQPRFLKWAPLHLLILIGGLCPIHLDLLAELRQLVETILCRRTWFNRHLRCLHLPPPMEVVITMYHHKPIIKDLSSLRGYKSR